MKSKPINVGVVGCGSISSKYFAMAKQLPILNIAACCDLDIAKARQAAKKHGIDKVYSFDQMLADDSIQIVLNLTVPKVHSTVALQAIEAGKHTYGEKPLAMNREEGLRVLNAAKAHGVRVGCAPDTFMGSGIQTACKLLHDGAIGDVTGFMAFMLNPGVESWHPNPEFLYEPGAGSLMDMGPYYLTALLNLFGSVKQVSGMATIAHPVRTITHKTSDGKHGPKYGKKIQVQTPDHVCATLAFTSGVVGSLVTSYAAGPSPFDTQWPIVIFGTQGTMKVPDPNKFDGTVEIARRGDVADWQEQAALFPIGYGRAVGLADMALAICEDRPHRASGEQALCVLDLMQSIMDASQTGQTQNPVTEYNSPQAMPTVSFLTSDSVT